MKDIVKNDSSSVLDKHLLEGIARTDTEKFYFLTSLIKKQFLMTKMKIEHK
jgi:hypothetical protein